MPNTWDEKGLPILTAAERAGMKDFWGVYSEHIPAINTELMRVVAEMPMMAAMVAKMTPKLLEDENKKSLELMRMALLENN